MHDEKALKYWIVLFTLLTPLAGNAVTDPQEPLPDPRQEARAEKIGERLRCLVCQNESIEASQAGLAKDLRQIVRQQVAAGKSDSQIISWMVARYGQFILLRPRFSPVTFFLWGSPLLALIGAAMVILLNKRPLPPAPLSAEERAKLDLLMVKR